MELKDINIKAQDLINFLNDNICFEDPTRTKDGFEVNVVYKFTISEITSFISSQYESQLKEQEDKEKQSNTVFVKQLHSCFLHTHEGVKSGNDVSISQTADSIVISGCDFKKNIDKHKND